jgi:trigger factor
LLFTFYALRFTEDTLTEPLIITTSSRDDHQLDMTIELGPERTEQALQRAYRQVVKKAKIPGFRPGKAPYATVLRMFGKEAMLGEILDDLGEEIYKEALTTEKPDIYGQAALEDVKVNPITFKLVVPLRPTVDLGDYRSIRLEAPAINVGEAGVDAALEAERAAKATLQTVDRPAALGDSAVVDIRGTVGEETIMDNQDWQLTLRGEGGWLPGFDEAFVGLVAGDEKAFSITYPEDSSSRFKGQVATFEVKVKEVKAKVSPEADDEFVKGLGDYTDLADYRAKKLAEITKQRTDEAEQKLNEAAVEALVAGAKLTYPPAAVDDTVHSMMRDLEARLSNVGYKLEDYLRLNGKTVEGYHDELHPAAETRLKGQLAIAELARAEGITVSDEEKQAELDRMAGEARDAENAAAIREAFGSEAGLRVIENDVRVEKALVRLREIVTGQAPELVPAADVAADVTPDVAADVAPDAAADVAPEAAADVAPVIAADVSSDVSQTAE